MDKLVTVIIPAWNAERWLENTLRSVLGQSYPRLRILVIDDGSTDGTAALLERLRREPERLAEERAQLLQQTRDLAFANYKTFIRGAECTERIHRLFGDVEESLGRLLDRLPSFQQSCRCGGPGARGASNNCNSCLYDDRNT